MKLPEIRENITLAKNRLAGINPEIKCYLVVMINGRQFSVQDFEPGNSACSKLLEFPDVFLPNQNIQAIVSIDKKNKTQKNHLEQSWNELRTSLEELELFEPIIELRFYNLDMEKIQEIKGHPLIQTLGKTVISPASINVVIA